MSWYNTQGPCQNHVLFSKVKYVRNVEKQNFYPLADSKRSADTFTKLDAILQKNGFRSEKITSGVTPYVLSLAERQFIERDFVYSDKPRALYVNDPCNLLVSLGGDNYVTVSSVVSGLNVNEARNMASGAEELIDGEIAFTYSESVGYLSPSPSECGSGVVFSSAIYLPSIRLSGQTNPLLSSLHAIGMSLSPMFAEEDNPGDIYILSYSPHYLCDEGAAAEHFAQTVLSISENEKTRICMTAKDNDKNIFTTALKALGILTYSDVLSESEMLSLLSDIRLCVCTAQNKTDALPGIQTLNYLVAEGLNCSVIVSSKEGCASQTDCDRARAKLVSSYIKHKNEVTNVK